METPRLTFFSTGALAYTLGLEVVIISMAASVDEELARTVFLIIPPTTEVGHAVAGVFWKAAYICRGTPESRTQSAQPQTIQCRSFPGVPVSMKLEKAPFPSHTLGVQHPKHCTYLLGDPMRIICVPGGRILRGGYDLDVKHPPRAYILNTCHLLGLGRLWDLSGGGDQLEEIGRLGGGLLKGMM